MKSKILAKVPSVIKYFKTSQKKYFLGTYNTSLLYLKNKKSLISKSVIKNLRYLNN